MSGLEFGQLAAHGFAKLTGAQRDAGADRPVAATASGSIVLPDGTEMMRSESGVIGIGVTPSPWHVNFKGIQTGGGYASFVGDGSNGRAEVLTNAYASGANTFSYFASLPATRYSQQLDGHIWYTAPSGTAGNPISFTQAMTLDGSGNLGIGTASPGYRIDVLGYGRFSSGLLGAGGLTMFGDASSGSGLLLDTAGNLGLGVTPSAWAAGGNLQIAEGGMVSASSSYSSYGANFYYGSGAFRYITTGPATMERHENGSINWQVAPSGTAGNPISFTQAMTLASNGEWNIDGSGGRVTLTPGGASNTINSTTTLFGAFNTLKYRASAHEWVNSAGTVIGQFDTSGNLQVGTTSGSERLVVSGVSGEYAMRTIAANSSGSYYLNVFYAGGANVGNITSNGTTTAYNTSSDARLKENISDAAPGSALIDQLQVRQFDWRADGSHQRYGFIAQELDSVYPEAVSKPADPEQMMGVDYSKLVPLLVQEVQSLRARLAALEAA